MYPETPGWKVRDTSKAAADAMEPKAPTLRNQVMAVIQERGPSTPEEILSVLLGRGAKTVLTSVRPRCTELAKRGLIEDSGARREAEGGQKAIVWQVRVQLPPTTDFNKAIQGQLL